MNPGTLAPDTTVDGTGLLCVALLLRLRKEIGGAEPGTIGPPVRCDRQRRGRCHDVDCRRRPHEVRAYGLMAYRTLNGSSAVDRATLLKPASAHRLRTTASGIPHVPRAAPPFESDVVMQ